MTNEQFAILDSRIQMLALSLTAAILVSGKVMLSFEESIASARRIVYDAKTSADAGNFG